MVARRAGGGGHVFLSVFRVRDRNGAIPGNFLNAIASRDAAILDLLEPADRQALGRGYL
jgi:hypothetical protein